jgi:hypothetical protein
MATETIKLSGIRTIDLGTIHTGELHEKKGKNFFSKVANNLWRVSFELGFSPPYTLYFRHSKSLSPREKSELGAYLAGL